jgi:ABC-type lipoprotein release transport system permease subunit
MLVGQRTRQVGIRTAQGAVKWMLVRQFVVEAVRPLVPGLAGGVCLALISARLLRSQLSP